MKPLKRVIQFNQDFNLLLNEIGCIGLSLPRVLQKGNVSLLKEIRLYIH